MISLIAVVALAQLTLGFRIPFAPTFQNRLSASKDTKLFVAVAPDDVKAAAQGFTVPTSKSANIPLKNEPVYSFGKGIKAKKNSKQLLGGKGANLGDMSSIGLSVPPGFTITTEVCAAFHKAEKVLPSSVWPKILAGLQLVESEMGRKFGDNDKPLLVSVRSGAAVSMPGMMDTILNLGLNDETVKGLSKDFGDRFAMDSYRRFLNMFGTVVMNIPHHAFEDSMTKLKASVGAKEDNDLTTEHLAQLVADYKEVYLKHNCVFPTNPYAQLYAAIHAVFDSWYSDRAIKYRDAEAITGLLGTAVNVQAMCFGNMGDTSGTGVCFTRNPNTGEKKLYGEYLINAQGEDVVAGIRTPLPISKLEESLPIAYKELLNNIEILEKHYGEMQDIEFTIQEGKLFMLQTRTGKRVGPAAVKIAVDMVDEGLTTPDKAVLMVKPEHLNQLLHPQFVSVESPAYTGNVIGRGLPASPGAAVGMIVFSPEAAEAAHAMGEKCVLVRDDTSPEDVGGMWCAEGVLTARGGMTSHAAVVARGWGKPCICGCGDLKFDEAAGTVSIRQLDGRVVTLREKEWISLNGDSGEILVGKQVLKPPSISSSSDTKRFMEWVDEKKTIRILANADTPADAAEARRNGAEGIGLTRTEHMFFSDERIRVVRRMILATDTIHRQKALDELLPYQRADFEGILEAMDGLPVTVRLLDPPLHEFLPEIHNIDESFANEVGMSKQDCIFAVERLQEVNPMLGLRGCRLGIIMPELVEMQARALLEAALNNKYNKNLDPRPEIMIPLVGSEKEYLDQSKLIKDTFERVLSERKGQMINCKVGTMIEVPRAALLAGEIADAGAEFFSYGTNDLTQMTYGFSRDDIGGYLPTYLKKGILDFDPFQTIDEPGVGQLINLSARTGKEKAEKDNRSFKAGICGEQGGDPKSVRFFVKSGLDYVSCSPFRVPVARLAAAQSAVELKEEENKEKDLEYTNDVLVWFSSGSKLYSNKKVY
eukprot:gene6074-8363_t